MSTKKKLSMFSINPTLLKSVSFNYPEKKELPQKIIIFENVGKYKGTVNEENKPEGVGKFDFLDGGVFIGQFEDGDIQGLGRLENNVDQYCYQGHWRDWKKHGKGKEEFWKTGETYDGNWVFGKREGYGKPYCLLMSHRHLKDARRGVYWVFQE